MIDISSLIGLANYFGITPEKLVPLALTGGVVYWAVNIRVGRLENKFGQLESKFVDVLDSVKNSITEIQTILRVKHKMTIVQTIKDYGRTKSPIVLKDEYRASIKKTGLGAQIAQKEAELVSWLKKYHPDTGIDAQNAITTLVASDEIELYLDLTEFKQLLYENGGTVKDVVGILSVYLFEVLIPKLFQHGKDKMVS